LIKIGEFQKLRVVRLSDLGYMLSDDNEDVLLHFRQATKEYKPNDMVNVFIYTDKAGRKTANESAPIITFDKPGFVKVTDVLPGAGVFVNINMPKDVLISKDYLPYNEAFWPVEGDTILAHLKVRKDNICAKPLSRFDIIGMHKDVRYGEGEHVDGYICKIADGGVGIVTVDYMYVFVPQTQLRGNYRLGEACNVTITKLLDEEYYGMLNSQKEDMIDGDKEIILAYINKHNGRIKLTAKTEASIIERELKMSRKAFKRAYGGLYKDRVIDFDDDGTFLVK
jgi:predicted RNA-binding protein (virulence factor B family)